MSYPKVFIIILNWNGLQDTLKCLASVCKLNYENFEVVVVDNGSSDDSVAVIRRNYPLTAILENRENLGYTGGNNVGMRYAMENGADYVWLLNNDTLVEEDTLSKLVAASNKSREIGLVSPVINCYDFPGKIQFCGGFVDWANHTITHIDDKPSDIDNEFINGKNVCLWGTALLIKSDVIKKIGYLEEKYFAYWEDINYSMRALKAGFRNLLEINATIYHKDAPKKPPHRMPYYFYLMARNQYFLWIENLKGLEKFSFSRKYIAKKLWECADFRRLGYDEWADACFDGTWAAIIGVGGRWDTNVRRPYLLKRILSWHPYFWARIFGANYLNIPSKILGGRKMRIFKMKA